LLTLQFLEIRRQLLADPIGNPVNEFNGEGHRNIHKKAQDNRVPVYNADLGADKVQPLNVTMDLQCDNTLLFDLSIDQSTFPAPDPGPSNVPRIHQVFDMGPESEVEEIEKEEGNDEPGDGDGYCIYFKPDIESESEDDETCGIWLEDPRIAQGERAHQLGIEQEIEEAGVRVLTDKERDNVMAMALKVGNQLTQKAYKGVQRLTQGRMSIASEYIAGQILERMSKLSSQIYKCCINSCICFTGEFEPLTMCPLCGEPRHDKWKKAQNRF